MEEAGANGAVNALGLETIATDTDTSPPRGNPFPIVGIGASAGGLEAFSELLSALPPDTGMAFVLVQHLDPAHESLLPELLAPHSKMPVLSVRDDLKVEPNHVYVIPPNTSIELKDGTLGLVTREPGLHLPIDIFFRSLAAVQGSRAIGVVLSGNASDGSVGVRDIKAECGITFAQNEASARFGGMPRNAVATGAVDYVLSPTEIARELATLAAHPFLVPSRPGDSRSETLPEGDGALRRIFALLNNVTKVDFSRYKPTTVRRRIGRRMMVLRIEGMQEYGHYIEHHSAELRELYRDLLISVTSFFRDPEGFDALTKLLVTALLKRDKPEDPIRVWVPGCATGEEVYSLAICLYDLLKDTQMSLPIQLFGTDISDVALDRARHGNYPIGIEEDVPPNRLRRFFTKTDNGYQINKVIRECCVFARHDVTKDPPFSNLDLVSCRNLLIYLDQTAQRHVLPVFHYALKPNGLLMLGSAETTAAAADLFIPADPPHKIYTRRGITPRLPLEIALGSAGHDGTPMGVPVGSSALEVQKKLDRVIQSKYSPDAVLINAEFQIVQFRGHTSSYLDPSPGQATLNVLRMATEDLLLPLRRAVQAVTETNAPVRESGIELTVTGQKVRVTLEVTPIPGLEAGERYFLIVFVREKSPTELSAESSRSESISIDDDLLRTQRELTDTRDYLRNLTEQYEVHSEELRAANEEARSANEELQSTNEELRTTKEELQSANEELTTVNEELQSRNQELNASNSDLKNLLSAITIPILMVDADLRVRRFNTAAGKLLELGPVDIGRPVGHIRGKIEIPRLEQQVKTVIDSLHPVSEELQDAEGRWHSLAIRPYRTTDDRIAGAVVTLQDIDPLKRGLKAAEEARDYAEGMIGTVREPLVVLDSDLRVQRATQAFYDTFLVKREETEGRFLYDLGNGEWNRPRLRELIGAALFRSEPFHDFEIEHDFPHIGRRVMRLNGRRIPFPQAQRKMLLLSIEDVTERREIAEIRFQRLFETAKDGIVVVDIETQTVQDINAFFLQLTGMERDALIGKTLEDVGAKLGVPGIERSIEAARDSELVRYPDLELLRSDGERVAVDIVANSYRVGSQPVMQFNVRDVSLRKKASKALLESEQRFRLFVESVNDYALFQVDTNGVILSWNAGAERLLGWKETEAIGMPASTVFTPEDVAAGEHQKEIETARTNGRADDERWHMRKDGTRFFASGVLTQVCDDQGNLLGFAKVMRDVTLRKEQEEQLHRSLSEKDTLVREIHHRVKNNLQVIVSLLGMQSRHTNDPHVLAAFQEAESRLRAIAHIHERLYASDDLSEVEFGGYVTALAEELVQLHASTPNQIQLELDLADVVLHIERAIPLGLIANELILNALKHGLRNKPGKLVVRLAYIPDSEGRASNNGDTGWARLQIIDSGPGLPVDFDAAKTPSMGLRLVNMLVRQLRGRLEIGPPPGANFCVSFPREFENRPKEL
ncbi:MAG TPA: chemotaxis protein CheB [Bryobacteraceae bacterium]|jgi:two-component system CheB/CheR fusion protein|nr:chemotaxis protein CheB [Bryobacteraceae bacterium]